jgi:hypothetical protein
VATVSQPEVLPTKKKPLRGKGPVHTLAKIAHIVARQVDAIGSKQVLEAYDIGVLCKLTDMLTAISRETRETRLQEAARLQKMTDEELRQIVEAYVKPKQLKSEGVTDATATDKNP